MSVYNLHKIKKLKRENGIMSFEAFSEKFEEKIDYSLMMTQQISNMLGQDVFVDDKGNIYFTRKVID